MKSISKNTIHLVAAAFAGGGLLFTLGGFLSSKPAHTDDAVGEASASPNAERASILAESPAKRSSPTSQPSASEMRSIEAQIQDALYRFDRHEDTIAAANNANGFIASFNDQTGALAVAPFDESWRWELAHVAAESIHANAEGNRLTVERSENLTEWFVNEPRGIEQGFTLTEPPADGRIAMRLTTSLSPTLTGGGDAQEIRFDDPETGETKLCYAELFVTDANGDRVSAEISVARHSNVESNPARGFDFGKSSYDLALVLDDSAARYPLTVDPIVTTLAADLVDAEFQGGNAFGTAAAISGDVMVVGSPGAQLDPKATVFERGADEIWRETATLRPSPHNSLFGKHVSGIAIHNDRIVVGAQNSLGGEVPTAYVFERNESGSGEPWLQTARLLADEPGATRFGRTVAIWEDTIVVSASKEGNGVGYVFELVDGIWQKSAKLTEISLDVGVAVLEDAIVFEDTSNSRAAVFERDPTAPQGWRHTGHFRDVARTVEFARNLAADGDSIVAAPIHADFTNRNGHIPIQVFERAADGSWDESAIPLPAREIYDISISGNRIAVAHENLESGGDDVVTILERDTPVAGAWGTVATFAHGGTRFAKIGAVDLSGDRLLATWLIHSPIQPQINQGRAVIYELRNGHWAPVAAPQPDAPQAGEAFGEILAVDRDVLVVGSPERRNNARGGAEVGTAYVFHRDGTPAHTWELAAELPLPDEVVAGDGFGASVATAYGEWIVVGAPGRDADGSVDLGSAYLYRGVSPDDWELVDTFVPSVGGTGQRFGEAVAMSSDSLHLLVGAPGDDSGRGRTFAYQRDLSNPLDWRETQIIRAAQDAEGTGVVLAMHGASAIVGAPDTRSGDGAIHVLRYTDQWRTVAFVRGQSGFGSALAMGGGGFGLVAEPDAERVFAVDLKDGALSPLTLPSGEPLPLRFGETLASNGEFAYVGAPQSDKVYVFSHDAGEGAAWNLRDVLKGMSGVYGGGLAASGRNLVLGMPTEGTGGKVEVQRMAVRQWSGARGAGSEARVHRGSFRSMAIDGDTLLIANPLNATTVSGSPRQGLVVVARRGLGDAGWEVEQVVTSDRTTDEAFGDSVDISGGRIIVGAPLSDAVYFFRRRSQGEPRWELDKRITIANDVQLSDRVAISGRHAVVALDGGDDLLQTFREIAGTGWVSEARLGVPAPSIEISRPADVAIDGDRIACIQNAPTDRCLVFDFTGDRSWTEVGQFDVGGFLSDGNAIAVSGDVIAIGIPTADFARDAEGVVHLYDSVGHRLDSLIGHPLPLDDGSTAQPAIFGRSLAMDGDYLVVGQNGAVSVFERYGDRWGRVSTLTGSEQSFGQHVGFSGSTVAVGAPDDTSLGLIFPGVVHVFEVDPDRDAFDEWRRAHFGAAAVDNPTLEETVWSPNADPDGDGVTNLREAYHGMDPLAPDAAKARLQLVIGDTMTLRWIRGLQTAGIEADIEWSTDLQTWFGIHETGAPAITTRIAAEEIGAFRMESDVNAGSLTKCFFRFRYRR